MAKKYWDDIKEGERLECRPFSFTVQEIIEFAEKYDPQPFHVDEQAALASIFGGIIASSLQTLSTCTRVVVDAMGEMSIIGGLLMEQAEMSNPVRPGDLLTLNASWADLRRSSSKPDRGIATLRFNLVNQKGETVMTTGFRYMIACRS